VQPGPPAPDGPEALVDVVDRLLDEVERALSRLDDGTYGRCEACEAAIEDSRLAEAPMTQTCAACAPPEGD
jgi:RNA polymerase-binding transcription factor DksA